MLATTTGEHNYRTARLN